MFTYAYVNPVGAALLGWLVLDEPITRWTVLGAALVILGVAGVFHERFRDRRRANAPTTGSPAAPTTPTETEAATQRRQ